MTAADRDEAREALERIARHGAGWLSVHREPYEELIPTWPSDLLFEFVAEQGSELNDSRGEIRRLTEVVRRLTDSVAARDRRLRDLSAAFERLIGAAQRAQDGRVKLDMARRRASDLVGALHDAVHEAGEVLWDRNREGELLTVGAEEPFRRL